MVNTPVRVSGLGGERMTSGGFTDNEENRVPHGNLNKIGSYSHLAAMEAKESSDTRRQQRETFGNHVANNAPTDIESLSAVFEGVYNSLDAATEIPDLSEEESKKLQECASHLGELEEMEDPIKRRLIVYAGIVNVQNTISDIIRPHLPKDNPSSAGIDVEEVNA